MAFAPLGPIEGEEHGPHMRIGGMAALQCSKGHRRFVESSFQSQFLDALRADPALVSADTAKAKGFLVWRRLCCPSCGEELRVDANTRFAAIGSISVGPLVSLGFRIDMPSYCCPACHHERVAPRDELLIDLKKASERAFRSVGVALH